jgi:uracil-DNA glycosylase
MSERILRYQQKCFTTYSDTVKIPKDYTYIDGNQIRPIVPVEVAVGGLMIVGAYPSARFESRKGKLLPTSDNLAPFYPELYFDGIKTRRQESASGLEEYFLKFLSIDRKRCWITDLVKVFLFKPEHISNYKHLGFSPSYEATRKLFKQYAKRSLPFLMQEVLLAQPKLILTLGEEVARVITDDYKSSSEELLNGKAYKMTISDKTFYIAHAAHPDACRRSEKWRMRTKKQILSLRSFVK